jgi:hypothetical protein
MTRGLNRGAAQWQVLATPVMQTRPMMHDASLPLGGGQHRQFPCMIQLDFVPATH